MKTIDIDKLRKRVERAHREVKSAHGKRPSLRWTVAQEDGSRHEIRYLDIKKPAEWEDQLHNLIHWIAVLKDHVKKGMDPKAVEESINECPDLCICIDLDNREKHVELTRGKGGKIGRSGRQPRIARVRVHFPMAPRDHPEIREQGLLMTQPDLTMHSKIEIDKLEFKYPKPDLIQVSAPVVDASGKDLGDAFDIAQRAIEHWEKIFSDLRL